MDNFTFTADLFCVWKDQENETGRYVKRFGGSRSSSIMEEVRRSGPACLTG